MKDQDYLQLKKITHKGDKIQIQFVSYLREDFVGRILRLFIKNNKYIQQIHFSSNEYGTADWVNGDGIISCHRWEDEDSVQSLSKLSKHYPTLLLNGEASADYAINNIIPDVLDYFQDRKFAEYIHNIITNKRYDENLDLLQFSIDISIDISNEVNIDS